MQNNTLKKLKHGKIVMSAFKYIIDSQFKSTKNKVTRLLNGSNIQYIKDLVREKNRRVFSQTPVERKRNVL